MSLATFEAAVLALAADALVDCGEDPVDHGIRYHTKLPILPGCCTQNGILSISWEGGETPTSPCNAGLAWQLLLRWTTCWPDMEPNPGGVTLNYPDLDARAARIADVAECVQAALAGEVCAGGTGELHEYASNLKLLAPKPIAPQGLCAGVEWRIVGTVRQLATNAPS